MTDTPGLPMQPLLDETYEFRREADRRKGRAIARLDEIDSHIETHKAVIAQLSAERDRLSVLLHAADTVLTIIPANEGPALIEKTDGGSTTTE